MTHSVYARIGFDPTPDGLTALAIEVEVQLETILEATSLEVDAIADVLEPDGVYRDEVEVRFLTTLTSRQVDARLDEVVASLRDSTYDGADGAELILLSVD